MNSKLLAVLTYKPPNLGEISGGQMKLWVKSRLNRRKAPLSSARNHLERRLFRFQPGLTANNRVAFHKLAFICHPRAIFGASKTMYICV